MAAAGTSSAEPRSSSSMVSVTSLGLLLGSGGGGPLAFCASVAPSAEGFLPLGRGGGGPLDGVASELPSVGRCAFTPLPGGTRGGAFGRRALCLAGEDCVRFSGTDAGISGSY